MLGPNRGSLQHSPTSLAGGEEASYPLPKILTPAVVNPLSSFFRKLTHCAYNKQNLPTLKLHMSYMICLCRTIVLLKMLVRCFQHEQACVSLPCLFHLRLAANLELLIHLLRRSVRINLLLLSYLLTFICSVICFITEKSFIWLN